MRKLINRDNSPLTPLGRGICFFGAGLFLLAMPWYACSDQFEGFKNFAKKDALEAFAKDVGGLIGSGAFHTGRSLGFPGVDVGVHVAGQNKPAKEDTIIKTLAGGQINTIAFPMIHGEIGLPYNFDVILRGISYQELALVGGGLRYGVFRSRFVPFIPSISVSGFTHVLTHDSFSLTHYSGNMSIDMALPIVQPYVGVGVDITRVKVKESKDATLVGLKTKGTGFRGVAGLNIKPFPLFYISGGYSLLHGESGFEASLGLKF